MYSTHNELENEEGDKKPDMNELNLPLQER